jgi:aerobic carbon-monoxide dehydrogenase medium subunit
LAAQAVPQGDGFADLRLAFFAVGDRPVLATAASKLVGIAVTPETLADASAALGEELDPPEDQQASSSMRRHLAKVLLARCVAALLGRPELAAGVSA